MRSLVAKALARVRGGDPHAGNRQLDPSPIRCPACGSRIAADRRAGTWACSGGHRFPTTRTLIAALIATGWRPALEVQRSSTARPGSALLSSASNHHGVPA